MHFQNEWYFHFWYTSDLVELVRSFGLLAHAYMLMICRYIVTWMLVLNRLCCNDSEIVLILLVGGCPRIDSSLTHRKRKWFGFTVVVGNLALLRITLSFLAIDPVHTVRDLRVMLDSNMTTMSQHVLRACQNYYFQIRLIRRLGNRNFSWCMHWSSRLE